MAAHHIAFGVALLLIATSAAAQPASTADQLLREGYELWRAGEHAKACAKFAASRELEPTVGNTLNLARCHDELGRPVSAYELYLEAANLATVAGQTERAQAARALAVGLEKKFCWLTITAPPGVGVTLDGKSAKIGQRTAIDPGTHTVVAKVRGFSKNVECARDKASEYRVEVPAEEPKVTPPPPPLPPPPAPPPPPPADSGVLVPIGWASAGLGLAGVVGGAIAGVLAQGDRDAALALCPDHRCDVATAAGLQGRAQVDAAGDKALASTIGITAGLGLAAVGVGILVFAPSATTNTSLVITPSLGGASVHARF